MLTPYEATMAAVRTHSKIVALISYWSARQYTGTTSSGTCALPNDRRRARFLRRAELTHWWAMGCGPLFVLWNPPLAAGLLIAYGVGVNLPFIAIQRYNRFRTQALIKRLSR